MKIFTAWEVDEAKQFAAEGGQALHLHRIIVDRERAPSCFVRAVDRGEDIAHLFDRDARRLEMTVRRLGVRVVVIEHRGTPRQHVDLCGAPLRKATELCEPRPPEPPKTLVELFHGEQVVEPVVREEVARVDGPPPPKRLLDMTEEELAAACKTATVRAAHEAAPVVFPSRIPGAKQYGFDFLRTDFRTR